MRLNTAIKPGKTLSLILLMSLTIAAGLYRNGFPAIFPFIHAGSITGRPTWGLINDRVLKGREGLGFLLINLINASVLPSSCFSTGS